MSVGGITLTPAEPINDGRATGVEFERRDLEIAALKKAEDNGLSVENIKNTGMEDLRNFLSIPDVSMKKLRIMAVEKGQITLALPEMSEKEESEEKKKKKKKKKGVFADRLSE